MPNGFVSNRSDCSEAAQPMRAEGEAVSVVPSLRWVKIRLRPGAVSDAKRTFAKLACGILHNICATDLLPWGSQKKVLCLLYSKVRILAPNSPA